MGMREEFEAWANDKGFCLDCRFFEEGNNFEDPDTALAFEIWEASRNTIGTDRQTAIDEMSSIPYVGYLKASQLYDAGVRWVHTK